MAARILAATLAASGLSHTAATPPDIAHGFGPSVTVAESRGPQIFNAIHDSMRQWGSSLHHNGMSFYLATVPEGVILHHGNNREESPTDPDWLAYEIEHAENFARGRRGGPGGGGGGPPGDGGPPGRGGPPGNGDQRRDFNIVTINRDGPQHAIIDEPYKYPSDVEDMDNEGGWLHVYRTTRPLRYLYVDGMGGGKTDMGTLDSQDYLLRGDRTPRRMVEKPKKVKDKRAPGGPGGPGDERTRAIELCKMCKDWKLAGVIRMEAGFEIIQCDFSDGLEQIQALQRPGPDNGGRGRGMFGNFEFMRGLSERYQGIGSRRTIVDFSSMVSAFFYPVNLTNPDAKRPDLPRLSNATDAELSAIKTHLTKVIDKRRDDSARVIDWQDVTDLIVGRYADRIQFMATKIESLEELAAELNFLLTVFTDYSGRDENQTAAAIERCTGFYLHGVLPVTEADHLIYAGITTVTSEICSRLFEARGLATDEKPDESSLAGATSILQSLVDYLGWARFKRCPSCAVDEVCVVPMWPFGTKGDYESPRCANSTNSRGDGENYWGGWGPGGPGRRPPGGGRDGEGPPRP